MKLDFFIFQQINNLAGKSVRLDTLIIFITEYLFWWLLAIAIFFLVYKRKRIISILKIFTPLVFSYIINTAISLVYFRPRPFVTNPEIFHLLDSPLTKKSFPSNHAALSFALALSVYFINKKLGIIFLVGAVLISLSRVYLGLHWPTDVLAGAGVGLIIAMIVNKIIPTIRAPQTPENRKQ